MKLGIVCARFNEGITKRMKKAALAVARKTKIDVVSVIDVPGAFDIPYAVKFTLEKKKVDAIAALGAVIKGETDHDVLIATVAAERIAKLSLKYGKPITLGIIGPNATEEQAGRRAEEYATRAVEAALALSKLKMQE